MRDADGFRIWSAFSSSDASPTDRGMRAVHGDARFNGHLNRAARDRPFTSSGSDHAQSRDYGLHAESCGVCANKWMDGRSVRRSYRVSYRDPDLYDRVGAVWFVRIALDNSRLTRSAGFRWRDDGARGPADRFEDDSEIRPGKRHVVFDGACSARSGRRPARGRVHRDLLVVAVDFLYQRADWPDRNRAGHILYRERSRRERAAARFARFRADRTRAGGIAIRTRDHRPRRGS